MVLETPLDQPANQSNPGGVELVFFLSRRVKAQKYPLFGELDMVAGIWDKVHVAQNNVPEVGTFFFQDLYLFPTHGSQRSVRRDWHASFPVRSGCGAEHLFLILQDVVVAGADLSDDPGFDFCSSHTLVNLVDQNLSKLRDAGFLQRFRKKFPDVLRFTAIRGIGAFVISRGGDNLYAGGS